MSDLKSDINACRENTRLWIAAVIIAINQTGIGTAMAWSYFGIIAAVFGEYKGILHRKIPAETFGA